MRQFVPMTDDMLFNAAQLPGPLVPYRIGVQCWHALVEERGTGAAGENAPMPTTTMSLDSMSYALKASAATQCHIAEASACR